VKGERVGRTGYLTLREGAEWLGMGSDRAAGRRLQRSFEAMERRDGHEIMVRRGAGPKPQPFVTRALLRAYFPEHFEARDRMVGVVRDRLGAIDSELRRGRVERRVLGRKVAILSAELAELRKITELPEIAAENQKSDPDSQPCDIA